MAAKLLACLLVVAAAYARPMWGPDGHAITAMVAEAFLNTQTSNAVNSILNGASLSSIASWADQVKSQPAYRWSYSLHFINTPDWVCNFVHSRDCADDVCVAGAITNYTSRLGSETGTQQNIALKFLTHFVGDIHQPLHCGFEDDKGGNTITGTFNGFNDNLHEMWDTWMIKERMTKDFSNSDANYAQYLVNQVNGDWKSNASDWASDTNVDDWGSESAGLACTYAYTDNNGNHIESGFVLGDDYYNFAIPVIDMQLAKGGVRLATVLNQVLGSSSVQNNKKIVQ